MNGVRLKLDVFQSQIKDLGRRSWRRGIEDADGCELGSIVTAQDGISTIEFPTEENGFLPVDIRDINGNTVAIGRNWNWQGLECHLLFLGLLGDFPVSSGLVYFNAN
jgi:hypothetical protein